MGAKLSGATTIITVDALPERLAMSRNLGADYIVNFRETDPVAEIARLIDGRGVDVAIEALGTQSTFESALRVLRPGGTLSSLGVYSSDLTLPLAPFGAGLSDLSIVTTLCPGADASPYVDNFRWTCRSTTVRHPSIQARSDRASVRAVRPSAGWRVESGDDAVSLTENHAGRFQRH